MNVRGDYLAFGKPNFSDEEIAAVTAVIRTGWVGMGPQTIAFEAELASALGAPHVVTLNSCTSALFLALLDHGVGPGDEVICPSLTWCASANAAVHLQANPVFCDVDRDSMCLTPASVAAKLTPKTKAVMVVHYGGLAADVAAIRAVLPEHVAIIEDAAHAFGAKFADGRPVGSSGNLTCFSFYANKNLSTAEGGAVALFDADRAERMRALRQHGLSSDAWKRYVHPQTALLPRFAEVGYKMNYTDLQAALGRVQLKRQPEFVERRLAIANYYRSALGKSSMPVELQTNVTDERHSRHLFVVKLPIDRMRSSRDAMVLALRERNIGASIHYAPLHKLSIYPNAGAVLPETERLCERILTLPISASMSLGDAEYVATHVNQLLQLAAR